MRCSSSRPIDSQIKARQQSTTKATTNTICLMYPTLENEDQLHKSSEMVCQVALDSTILGDAVQRGALGKYRSVTVFTTRRFAE